MSKLETPASNLGSENGNPDLDILGNHELDAVSGGFLGSSSVGGYFRPHANGEVLGQIVSPRDPASGLPTGK
jgi:hypothetical protein